MRGRELWLKLDTSIDVGLVVRLSPPEDISSNVSTVVRQ